MKEDGHGRLAAENRVHRVLGPPSARGDAVGGPGRDVRLEAYDVEADVSARSSDGIPPRGWRPEDPMHAIRRGEPVVAVLLHPRSWGGAPTVNARADLVRLREGCVYRLRRARRRR